MRGKSQLLVEVAYALPDKQRIVSLRVPSGTTARQVVRLSGIVNEFPEIDPESATLGIFSRVLDGKLNQHPDTYVLCENDRVEIYRALQIDPKQARLARAAKAENAKKSEKKQ